MQNKSHPFLTRLKYVQRDGKREIFTIKKILKKISPFPFIIILDSKKMRNFNSFQNLYVDNQIIALTLQASRKKFEHKSQDYYMKISK